MRELRRVTGRVAVLDRPDVDTDQIIPKQFLKRIERSGYGEFLFFDWMKDPEFELHRPEYEGAQILLAGRNFGCGSSREHAAWALEDYGFRAVLAPSYGDIFRSNAVKSGLAPIELPEEALAQLKAAVAERNGLTLDLEAQEISHPDGLSIGFDLDPYTRETLVHGLDDVARTLKREDRIAVYEAAGAARFDTRALGQSAV
jgi:3-isopropylmalate/(R)-2-methylmalate dehydratase small subunit